MNFTRDSLLLWLMLAASVVGYFAAAGKPPTEWTYSEWLQFVAAVVGIGIAKLQNSPLPSTAEKVVMDANAEKRLDAKKLVLLLALAPAALLGTACANNPAAKLSPEGKAAYYGEKFMSGVEVAQQQVIGLVGQAGITRQDVTPAVEVFVQIGRAGQDFAAALKVIDDSGVTETSKQEAGVRVRAAIVTFQNLLAAATARVPSESARTRIAQIIAAVQLGATLLDVWQHVGPLLPKPLAPPELWLEPAA